MNPIKAVGGHRNGWWEIELLELDVVADGESEEAMLDDLAHTLFGQYALAKMHQRTPFVNLLRNPSDPRPQRVPDAGDKLCRLNLPEEVSQALAAVLHAPQYADPEVSIESNEARAA